MLAAYTSTPPLSGSSHELYLMLGTSSAALVGLLFVATSLHLAEIANEDLYRLRAQYTTLILLSTLLVAIAVLMPQPLWILWNRMSCDQYLGTFAADHASFKSGQNSRRTWARRFLGSPLGVFYCRVCRWDRRVRSACRRPGIGNVCDNGFLCEPAGGLHMEWLDDHAGYRKGERLRK